ncbi:MAG: hypothetical protein ABUL45_06315, partial [Rhodanobacter sp.]
YGVSLSCDDESRMPLYQRFLLMALMLGVPALWFRRSLDDSSLGTLCGITVGFAVLGLVLGIARWRRRHPDIEELP